MTITTEFETGAVRTFSGCTQVQINQLINYIQKLRDEAGLITQVKIIVTD